MPNRLRPRVCLVMLLLLLSVTGGAASTVQWDLDNVLRSDPRNSGVLVSVLVRDGGSTLVYNLTSVAPTNSMSDVFRVFLQFASTEKDRDFKSVELSARGRPKFLLAGSYFKLLGQEFGTQNPIYTIRTFPENVTRMDGSHAFPTWTGGWLGVSSKQMTDFNEFHQQWWLMDFAPGAAAGKIDENANNVVPATSIVVRQAVNSQPSVAVETPSAHPSAPMDAPRWLSTFPGARDRVETPSPGAIAVSFSAPVSPDDVVKFYRERFDQDGVTSHIAYNGLGTTVQAFRDNESCVIRIADASAGAL
jgi:hypothetical protein